MENAPNIILFWYIIIAILVLMIALMITAYVFYKKSKSQSTRKMQLFRNTCLILGIICAIPIILVVGYVLYLYLG